MTKKSQAGFTLVEMMIVVGIILLMAGYVAWNFSGRVRPRKVMSGAQMLVSYLEIARSEAMKQQLFPYLLTQENIELSEGYPDIPRYWPFLVHLYSEEKDFGKQYWISVQAFDISGDVAKPPSDTSPTDHSYDLYTLVALPFGIILLDPNTGEELELGFVERPLFWRRDGAKFVTGTTAGAGNGIAIADATEHSMRAIIRIDPIYGTITLVDETK